MATKEQLRQVIYSKLDDVILQANKALNGESLAALEPVLARIGPGNQLPHWYEELKKKQVLPNLDGKTIGSVIEMLLVAVLETSTLKHLNLPPFKVNPARGVDLPDLDLGIKSPSENYCTSEPFFSAYERLLGSEYDALVLLTDYQQAKKNPPLRLQIIKWRYLKKTQIADAGLCRIAKKHRDWLVAENESWAKKVFRFLAFVNQSDWRAKRLLSLVDDMQDDEAIRKNLAGARKDFDLMNKKRLKKDQMPIAESDLQSLENILRISPLSLGVIDAADNWVVEVQKDLARAPNDNEWQRILASPLDGAIGMSFALQWRYNFGKLFGKTSKDDDNAI